MQQGFGVLRTTEDSVTLCCNPLDIVSATDAVYKHVQELGVSVSQGATSVTGHWYPGTEEGDVAIILVSNIQDSDWLV